MSKDIKREKNGKRKTTLYKLNRVCVGHLDHRDG